MHHNTGYLHSSLGVIVHLYVPNVLEGIVLYCNALLILYSNVIILLYCIVMHC